MSAPEWLRWIFAAAMTAVALYHLCRLAVRRCPIDSELTHGAAGAVMTVMLIGTLTRADGRTFAVIFGALALWFAGRGVHEYVMDGAGAAVTSTQLVVGCCAMVYMLTVVAVTGSAATPGMAMATASAVPQPALAWLLVLAVGGVTAWSVSRLRAGGRSGSATITTGCQMAMNVTTVFMLVTG